MPDDALEDVKRQVDFTEALMTLPVASLLKLCNTALNRMTIGELAETMYDAGLQINFDLVEKDRSDG